MGYFLQQRPDGRSVAFKIAGEQPTPEEQARISSILSGQTPQAQKPSEDIGIGQTFVRSLGRGVDAAQAGLYTAGQGIAALSDDKEFLGKTPEEYQELAEEQRKQRDAIQVPQESFFEAEGPYNKIRSLIGTVGESAPAMAGGAAAIIGGTALGGPVGGALGTLAAAGMYAPQLLNENAEAQIQEHGFIKDWDKAFKATAAQAAVESFTDRLTLGVAGVLKKPLSPLMREAVEKGTKKGMTTVARMGGAAGVGAAGGATEETLQSVLNRWQAEKPTGDEEAQAEYLEAAVVGGIIEGVFGGGFGAAGAVKQTRAEQSWRDALADADTEAANIQLQAETNIPEAERRRRAAVEDETADVFEDVDVAGQLPDYSGQRTAVQTALEKEENLVPEAEQTPFEKVESAPFSETEYVNAIDMLRDEKLVSPDKIKTTLKVGRPKANAIFQQLLERNDAAPAGSRGQYLKVTTPRGLPQKTGSDITGETTGTQRDYIVRPVDQADQKPYRISVKGKKRGPAFQTEAEAQAFAANQKLPSYEIERTQPSQYGIYELQTRPTKDGGEELVGKRVVNTFMTQEEANEAVKDLDPAYSPESNRWRRRLSEEEKNARINADKEKELGKAARALQRHMAKMVGPKRVRARVVSQVQGPEGTIAEGVTIAPEGNPDAQRIERGLRQIVEVSGDLVAGDQDAINAIGTHEVVHVLRNADLLSKKEWDNLERMALNEKVPDKTYTWMQRAVARNRGQSTPYLSEEAIAEMLRYYAQNPTKLNKSKRNLLQKLMDFIKKVSGLAKRHNGNDVIQAILTGEIASRPEGYGGLGPRPYPGNEFYSSVVVPGFYLKSDKFFQNVKQEKAQGHQWLGMIKPAKSGIAQEELNWLNLEDWLKSHGSQPVTRGDILDYIRANSLDVQERTADSGGNFRDAQEAIGYLADRIGGTVFDVEDRWRFANPNDYITVADNYIAKDDRSRTRTYHEGTTQEGGKDYTELLIHIPTLQPEFSIEHHYGGFPNVIAAVRFKTRNYGDGKKVLFIEEIQSDLHQRQKQRKAQLAQQRQQLGDDALSEEELFGDEQIPDAPFKTTWDELAFKRIVRYAAENDFDAVAWHGEPDSVALTEGYLDLKEDDGRFTAGDGAADVTGVINTYTDRIPSWARKYFKKFNTFVEKINPRFQGNPIDEYDFAELIQSHDDLQSLIVQAYSNGKRNMLDHLAGLSQIARNQRVFDINEAVAQSDIDPDQLYTFIRELEGGSGFNVASDAQGNPMVSRWQMDLSSDLKQSVIEEGQPYWGKMWSAISTEKRRDLAEDPNFQNWFKNSVVVDEEGLPRPVFHGTRADVDFSSFRALSHFGTIDAAMDRMAISGFFDQATKKKGGNLIDLAKKAGVYDDIINAYIEERNYTPEGYEIPRILDEWWGNLDPKTRFNAVSQNDPAALERARIYPVYLSIQKPLKITDDGGLSDWKELTVAAEMTGAIFMDEGAIARRGSPEGFLKMLERKGYDGFVYENTVEDPGSESYVPFRPQQVKSPFNRGTWNPDDKRINYSAVMAPQENAQYSAAAPMGQRVPPTPNLDELAEVKAKITYDNLSPVLKKISTLLPNQYKYKFERKVEDTFIGLQDRMLPLAQLIDRMKKNDGFITNENDVYFREQLFSGQADALIQEANRDFYEPLVEAVRTTNVTQEDAKRAEGINDASKSLMREYGTQGYRMGMANLYLYARHAQERNAVMASRNDPETGRVQQHVAGSGMTDLQAQEILDWFDRQPFGREFSDLSNPNSIRSRMRALINHTNDIRVDGGLNPDFRVREDGMPANLYEDYVPLRGFIQEHYHPDDDASMFARTGKGYNIRGREDLAALGRESLATDIIATATLQNEESIIRAQKNKVGQSFLQLIRDNPKNNDLSDVAQIIETRPVKWGLDRKNGVVKRVPDMRFRNDPMILTVKEGGKETYVRFRDPRLAKALGSKSSMGDSGMEQVMKGLLWFNRMIGSLSTSYNPEFLISNFFRDIQTANINLTEYEMQALRREVMKSVPVALKAVYSSQRNGDRSNPWVKEFEEFRHEGGMTAFMGLHNIEDTIRKINKALAHDHTTNPDRLKAPIKVLGKFIEDSNLAVENGVRLATYKALKDRFLQMTNDPTDPKNIKRAREDAAFAAKNLTVNFNMGGSSKPLLNSMYLFYNASMQGSMAMINPLIRSKKVRRIWAGILAAGFMMDLLNALLSEEDDDGRLAYDKIPDYILEHNWVLPDLFGMSERGYYKIPMPYLMNGIFNFGRSVSRGMRGGYTPGEAMTSGVGTMAEALNPFGGMHSFLNFVAPTVLDPFVDLARNEDFTEAPIAPPEPPFGVSDVASQRYWNNTNPAYVTIANWVSRLTGGDAEANMPGMAEWSPNTYEYAMEFLTGGAGAFAMRVLNMTPGVGEADPIGKWLKEEDFSVNDIIFLRRFMGNVSDRENVTRYVRNRDQVLRVRKGLNDAVKDGNQQAYLRIIEQYPEEYRLAARINNIENQRRKISRQIKKIRDTKSLNEAEKESRIKILKEHQQELVRLGNQIMGDL